MTQSCAQSIARMGIHSSYTPELAAEICTRIETGESLRSICRDLHMPDERTVRRWYVDDVEGFAPQYARARDIALDLMAEDVLDIADDGKNDWMERNDPENPGWLINGEHQARSRLRVDSRKWYLSKLAPKRYGDRLALEHGGVDGKPLESRTDPEHATKLLADIVARVAQLTGSQPAVDAASRAAADGIPE